MSSNVTSRRAVAEIDVSGSQFSAYKIGNRSIHGFWHLFSSHFRHVLVPPQRRPESGQVAWTWREATDGKAATPGELAALRRRLSEARASLAASSDGADRDEGGGSAVATLEAQVVSIVGAMVGRLLAEPDSALSRFVCRTDTGLMIHSWGSPVAAIPHFPDVHGGEVSGTVLSSSGRPLEARLVLRDRKGAQVAAVESGRNGGFRFADVAEGSYSILVPGRSDFPAEGTAVTLDHGPVTGLELRATAEPSKRDAASRGAASAHKAWYARPVPLGLLVLAFAATGVAAWLYVRPTLGPSQTADKPNVFQVANGGLVEGDGHDKDTSHSDLATEIKWPSLSDLMRAIRAPFSRKPARASTTAASRGSLGIPSSGGPLNEEDAAAAGTVPSDGATGQDPRRSGDPAASRRQSSNAANSSIKTPPKPVARVASSHEKDPTAANGKSAEGAVTVRIGASPTGTPPSQEPAESAGTGSKAVGAPTAAVSTVAVRKMIVAASRTYSEPTTPTTVAASSAGPEAATSATGADAGGDGASAMPSGPAGGSSNGLSAPAGGRSAEAAAPEAVSGTGPVAVAAVTEVVVAKVVAVEGKAARPQSTPVEKPLPSSDKPSRAATSPERDTAALPPDEAQADAGSDTVPAVARTRSPRKEAQAKRSLPQQPAKSSVTATAPEDEGPDGDPDSGGESQARIRAAIARTQPPAPNPSDKTEGAPAEQAPEVLAAMNVAPSSPHDATHSAAVEASGPSMVSLGHLRSSDWKPQVFRDTILPTRPVPISQQEAYGALRQDLLKERLSRMPPSFRHPQVSRGFVFEFSADKGNAPLWRELSGGPVQASIRGNRAELTLSPGEAARTYVLGIGDARTLARVTVGRDGTPSLTTAPGTRSSYWIGFEHPKAEGSFSWRLASGELAPESWIRDDHWQGERGQSIAIPLEPPAKGANRFAVALVDPATGCGISCSVVLD